MITVSTKQSFLLTSARLRRLTPPMQPLRCQGILRLGVGKVDEVDDLSALHQRRIHFARGDLAFGFPVMVPEALGGMSGICFGCFVA